FQLEQHILGPVYQGHGEASEALTEQKREPPRLKRRVLVAQRPDADVGQVLAEPGGPVVLELPGVAPVVAGVAVEPVDEDDIPDSLRVSRAMNGKQFGLGQRNGPRLLGDLWASSM